ncbi:hypothetical protein O3M35_000951 [Rhynocoris fuscipes]|uniref:DUF4774 domain-containing protein n=1 Tax=Rhynocoris fuscipes TaxID=488301 RepID=A0AAW1DSL0_9HEMI
MKIFLGLLFVASSLARPEIGIESSRDINAQQLTPYLSAAHLPETSGRNEQIRTAKDRQIFLEEAQIPVQLVYESDEETQAFVKEVSMESMFRKPQGKLLNRVERSDVSDLIRKPYLNDNKQELNKKRLRNDKMILAEGNEDDGVLPVDADQLNRGLGIEARHQMKSIDSLNLSPVASPIDYNYNVIKELIRNIDKKNEGATRTIQHYQSMLHSGGPSSQLPLDQNVFNDNKHKLIKVVSYYPAVASPDQITSQYSDKLLNSYLPFTMQNPFNSIWSALTNIVEYNRPNVDSCKTESKLKRKRRELNDEQELLIPQSIIDDLSRRTGMSLVRPSSSVKLKVRRGGIAIAGPGGIATAGSGGTTIVGPGGTALTPPDATAIVGPGGRVIHIPSFDSISTDTSETNTNSRTSDLAKLIKDHGKLVAHGPIVLYNPSNYHMDYKDFPTVVESL